MGEEPGSPAGRRFPLGVRTLDADELLAAAADLWGLVTASDVADHTDLLVGVRTGGWEVACALTRGDGTFPPLMPLACRRPSTATKQSAGMRVLRRLPRRVRDWLRLLEHRWLTRGGAAARADGRSVDEAELAAIRAWLAHRPSPAHLLVIDDAVDTGATLRTVVDVIARVAPAGTRITTAVITVTTADPLVRPDHALLEGWLCRFPWSFDA